MSIDIEEKDKIPNGKQKKVSLDIHENIMTKRFMHKTLKSMEKAKEYSQDIVFNSPLADSMVMKLHCSNGKLITLSTDGDSGVSMVVSGEYDDVQTFIHKFTVEALSILATELSLCLKTEHPTISEEKLLQSFRGKLHQAIESGIKDCV